MYYITRALIILTIFNTVLLSYINLKKAYSYKYLIMFPIYKKNNFKLLHAIIARKHRDEHFEFTFEKKGFFYGSFINYFQLCYNYT
jgi:hypothetical protein